MHAIAATSTPKAATSRTNAEIMAEKSGAPAYGGCLEKIRTIFPQRPSDDSQLCRLGRVGRRTMPLQRNAPRHVTPFRRWRMLAGVQPAGRSLEVQRIYIYRLVSGTIADHFAGGTM